jgi:hypothetical protein
MSRTGPTDSFRSSKSAQGARAPDKAAEIEQRIERLEKRLEETIAETQGVDQHHRPKLDDSEVDDPLRRSVERVNDKREGSG